MFSAASNIEESGTDDKFYFYPEIFYYSVSGVVGGGWGG